MNLKEAEKAIIEGTIKRITSNVISIKENRFSGPAFALLTSASFPSATSIGSHAFEGCSSLTSASFPSATSIGSHAFSNCTNLNLHLYTGIVSIGAMGEYSALASHRPPKAIYFHYSEDDEVLFSPANAIGAGYSKASATYNIYTDNTIIKDGVLSKADQYTIVNVKHLDGSDW